MKKQISFVVALVLLLVLCAGCNEPSGDNNSTTTTTAFSVDNISVSSDFSNGVTTVYKDKEYGFQLENPQKGDTIAILHTTKGDISIRLFPEAAPKAVENFVTHAKEGYYNGLLFHRVVKDFMIQGGDPDGRGTGGTSIWGTAFEDEFDSKLLNLRGALSMANSGVNSNKSQFFINQGPKTVNKEEYKTFTFDYLVENYKSQYINGYQVYGQQFIDVYGDFEQFLKTNCAQPVYEWVPEEVWDLYKIHGGNIHLDGAWRMGGGHTVFGQVFQGMDIVDEIAEVEVDENDKPINSVIINSIEILTF
ncbi:MAG: peptidylprolyl isomerase [Clostridia bacterium]|nr:peptidylprolyl isomerase [Clostridia bacterium]